MSTLNPLSYRAYARAFARLAALSTKAAFSALVAACATLADLPDVTRGVDAGADADLAPGDGAAPSKDDGGTDASSVDGGSADSASPRDAGLDSACGDTSQDAHNCGSCGHDCLGGMCTAGVCQPLALVPRMLAAAGRDIAVVGNTIYWTEVEDEAVRKASAVDGTALVTLARGQAQNATYVDSLAVGGGAVLWANSQSATGAIARCDAAGCGSLGSVIVPNRDAPKRIFLEGDTVFWTEPTAARVMSAKAADGSGVLVLVSGVGAPSAVTADATSIYWADTDGSIYRAPRGGGARVLAAKGEPGTTMYLRVDTSTVYWAVFKDAGFVYAAPKNGTGATPTTLASAQPRPNSLAVDATHVYWSNIGFATTASNESFREGSVYRCRLPSCVGGPEAIALHQKRLWSVAVDDAAIYWSAAGNRDGTTPGELDGALWKRAK